jgi:Na+-transporting NADH:ubiquinone oxidoreductase subunit F
MTFLMPILLMNAVLFTVTVLILIADKLLVTYGACRITVREGDESRAFTVEGGSSLLSYLKEGRVEISSSCGGKGSCGYCKCRVEKGGGQILPTEEIFMTKQEKAGNMRLACQVKVKNDIEIFIPDYLDVVRQMVLSKKFDRDKRWKVTVF